MGALGLIARCDQSGLGAQTFEVASHMNPSKILVIDVSHLYNKELESNKRKVFDYAGDVQVCNSWNPSLDQFMWLCDDMDAVYSAETFYGHDFVNIARRMGVKTVLHANPEFLDYIPSPRLPRPDVLAVPTEWLYDQVPDPKILLPFPVAVERFADPECLTSPATNFLHIVGRPAANDRNGTSEVLSALEHVDSQIRMTIRCTQPGYVESLMGGLDIPSNVDLVIDDSDIDRYWRMYDGQQVLAMPRRWGGMCLPIQEALGAGMPAIVNERDIYATQLPSVWAVASQPMGSFMTRTTVEMSRCDPIEIAYLIDLFATNKAFCETAHLYAALWAKANSWETLKPMYDAVLKQDRVPPKS